MDIKRVGTQPIVNPDTEVKQTKPSTADSSQPSSAPVPLSDTDRGRRKHEISWQGQVNRSALEGEVSEEIKKPPAKEKPDAKKPPDKKPPAKEPEPQAGTSQVQVQQTQGARPTPPPLGEQRIQQESETFLRGRGHTISGATDAERTLQVRSLFQRDPNLRRDFLCDQALNDHRNGASGLESFSNSVQRSRWANTTGDGPNRQINREEVGRDVGLLFAGTDNAHDALGVPLTDGFNHRWNVNRMIGDLPPSGFRRDMLDDVNPGEDQTHHLAYYTMVGATYPTQVGDAGAWGHDIGRPNDQRLGYRGVELGDRLGDPNFDVNSWIRQNVGDPNQGPVARSPSTTRSSS